MSNEIYVKETVLDVLKKEFSITIDDSEIDEELEVLGIDSILYVQLIISLEDVWECELDDEVYDTVQNIKTIRNLVEYVVEGFGT